MTPIIRTGAVIQVVLLACACIAGQDGGSDEQRIRTAIDKYVNALNGGDPRDAYNVFSEESREVCSFADFSKNFSLGQAVVSGFKVKVLEVRDLKLEGDQATAVLVTNLRTSPRDLRFIHEENQWRLLITAAECG